MAQAVPVEVAGRSPDGQVFVEKTETRDLSRHGGCISTRHVFAVGAPIAIRREGSKAAKARVISAAPGPQPGLLRLGVEFVGEESYWDCEFPREWSDATAEPAASADAGEAPPRVGPGLASESSGAAARQRLSEADSSLEAVVRKAETVRAQADAVLQECATQVEMARRQSAAALVSQMEALAARKESVEQEFAAQARSAGEAIRAQVENARASAAQQVAQIEEQIAALRRQLETSLEAGQEEYREFVAASGQRAAQMVEELAAEIETRRKTADELEAQSARWREQADAFLAGLRQESERRIHTARAEIFAAALAGIQEFRQQIPQLGEEASRFFTAALAEQKAAAAQWVGQWLDTARASLIDLENTRRAALGEHARQQLEHYTTALQARLEEARTGSEAVASTLEARLQRARSSLGELADWSDRTISRTRAEMEAVASQTEARLGESAAQRLGEVDAAVARGLEDLRRREEALENAAVEAARRLDNRARELQEMSVEVDRGARQKREELEALSASLLSRCDQRKDALDRLLELLESGRKELRADLSLLRADTEEHQGRLQRLAAEREMAFKARAVDLEQKLLAGATQLESALQERVGASLKSAHAAFGSALEQAAAQSRAKFQGSLDVELEKAAGRISELVAALDRSAEKHTRSLEEAAAGHASRLEQLHRELDARVAAALEGLDRRAADLQDGLRHTSASAVAAVEERQGKAAAAGAEILTGIQQARAGMARDYAEMEVQARQRQQAMEARFAALSSELQEKHAALDTFSAQSDRTKAELAQAAAALDRRLEEARAALQLVQREGQAALDRRAAALGDQMRDALKQSVNACQHELEAMAEAAQGVFEASLRSMADQAVDSARRLIEQDTDNSAASLDRSLANVRRSHEQRIQQLAQQAEDAARDQNRRREETSASSSAALNEQVQQITRLAVERVREAHEMLLRDIPPRMAEAEMAFRQNLERMIEQAREDTTAALRVLCSQWVARGEVEARQRSNEATPAPQDRNGDEP